MSDELLTPEDLAEWLQVSIATIYAWRYHKTGPLCLKVGRHLRYRRTDVETWLETCAQEGANDVDQ